MRCPILLALLASSITACGHEETTAAKSPETPAPAAQPPTAPPDEAQKPEPFSHEALLNMMSPAEASPDAKRGLRVNEPGAFEGYTLLEPLNSRRICMIDMQGEVVHEWPTDSSPGGWVYLQDDGTLLRCGREDKDPKFRGGGIGGRLQRLAPDGTILWQYEIADEQHHQHHDIEPLPNGNILTIAWERKSEEEAIAHGRHPDWVGAPGLWPDAVYEIRPSGKNGGEIVWSWHAWDHMIQDVDEKKPGYGVIADHPGRIDINFDVELEAVQTEEERKAAAELVQQMAAVGYVGGEEEEEKEEKKDEPPPTSPFEKSGDFMHTNAVDYHPGLDLILLSSPDMCEIFVIDHSTTTQEAKGSTGGRYGHGGELLWRWGNPHNYGAGTKDARHLSYQHDPSFIRGATDLRVLVFNNGGERPNDAKYSSVEELVLPFDAARGFAHEPGKPFGPAQPVWSYSDPATFFAAFISGAQRLPNGNTLICSGPAGRGFEVTAEGRIVWDFLNPFGGDVEPPEHAGRAPPLSMYRVVRLAPEHPGVKALLH